MATEIGQEREHSTWSARGTCCWKGARGTAEPGHPPTDPELEPRGSAATWLTAERAQAAGHQLGLHGSCAWARSTNKEHGPLARGLRYPHAGRCAQQRRRGSWGTTQPFHCPFTASTSGKAKPRPEGKKPMFSSTFIS